ncbi:MAG: hypothetical protein J6O62_03030 [Bacilli bacterium]|nr:hypothetical protein [Bacilli bacterium]
MKKSIVMILIILGIGILSFLLYINFQNNNGDKDAIKLITKYWNGYKSYDAKTMSECFYGDYVIKNHTTIGDTGYFYTYEKPVIKYVSKYKKGEDYIYNYKLTCKYEAGTNKVEERGTTRGKIKLIKYKNSDKYYIYEEPTFK